jgi:hypothetical protein
MKAFETRRSFAELLKADERIAEAIPGDRIDALINGSEYLGLSATSVGRVLDRAAEALEQRGGDELGSTQPAARRGDAAS